MFVAAAIWATHPDEFFRIHEFQVFIQGDPAEVNISSCGGILKKCTLFTYLFLMNRMCRLHAGGVKPRSGAVTSESMASQNREGRRVMMNC